VGLLALIGKRIAFAYIYPVAVARRLNQEKVMSRAVSSAPWGLARWCLAVAPSPLGGGGTRTTAGCPGKCPEYEIPRDPVISGASAACARREAEALPATNVPPRPVQQPTGPVLCGGRFSGRPHAPPVSAQAHLFGSRLSPSAGVERRVDELRASRLHDGAAA
jgi:hypothetical protein